MTTLPSCKEKITGIDQDRDNSRVFRKQTHLRELILWHLEVQRSRTFSSTAGDVVVRTVAWAEPAVVVAGLADRHAAQVGAHTKHDEPLRLLGALFVGFGVSESLDVDILSFFNLGLGSVTDEDGLSTPLC